MERTSPEERDCEKQISCGILGFYPQWLQFFASKKTYVILFGLVGLNQLAIGSYAVATITTLEKRFKIQSLTSGIIAGGWDIGTIFSSITMAYIGSKGHKTRWVAFGTLLTSLACYSQLLPYILYGPGHDAIALANTPNTTQYSSGASSWCGPGALLAQDCDDGDVSDTPPVLLFMSQFFLGVGTSMYWTLGIAYLDDNVRKDQAPLLLAISSTIRLLGSPLGFWVAARSLELYVNPSLSPSITNKDARWIGAWWIGWIPFGVIATFYSFFLTLFPRVLPRAFHRMKVKTKEVLQETGQKTARGFLEMLQRLFNNRLLLCNTFSYVFYMFGVIGYWIFMPKYMETQFHLTASDANLITGTMGLISSACGVILSGFVLSKIKPSARKIAGWNFLVEALGVLCVLTYTHLGCSNSEIHGNRNPDGSWNLIAECNSQCNCGPTVPYEPVCDPTRSLTFYSPCHAGCTDVTYNDLGNKIFTNCSCIPDTLVALDSFCPVDCRTNLTLFLVLYSVMSFLSSTAHSGLVIIQFRAVDPEDKSVSIALSEMLCSALAYIPGPIVYGNLLDKACLVWGDSCGEQGNCWLYFGQTLRYYLNYTAAGFLSLAVLFDCGIWYYSKNLALYEEDEGKAANNNSTANIDGKEVNSCEGDVIALQTPST
ncbi:solute carrier organic anion transporter family member 74D-like isoform X1 [Macrosteles quadrilineatus]|uniref:solute carrier organic anion transporter family member 74D-like isoform X1 n=1 Tax=Macrosteles quadrilineatus TaxID=74068 RepID=UPI0023E188F2|nr:solute carrier organic anion transporter family member 74D-like isoform X1 [Macrosteles quadrilineatus]